MFNRIIKRKMIYQIKINNKLFSILNKVTSKDGVYESGFKEIPMIFTYSCCRKDLDVAYKININNIEILTCYCIDEMDDFKNSRFFKNLIELKKLTEYYS